MSACRLSIYAAASLRLSPLQLTLAGAMEANVEPNLRILRLQPWGKDRTQMCIARLAWEIRSPSMELLQSTTKVTSTSFDIGSSNLGTMLSINACVPPIGQSSQVRTGRKRSMGFMIKTKSVSKKPLSSLAMAFPVSECCTNNAGCVGDSICSTEPPSSHMTSTVNETSLPTERVDRFSRPSLALGAADFGVYRGATLAGSVKRKASCSTGNSMQYRTATTTSSPGPRFPMDA
mmetsp:Transcript_43695/g.120967  ORF Transcript_43695/g.120967 Transcript_43695/m.120967 type:complete len:233 (+) Transcript_43695:2051-2749(+)